jgi:hypothetical protein
VDRRFKVPVVTISVVKRRKKAVTNAYISQDLHNGVT